MSKADVFKRILKGAELGLSIFNPAAGAAVVGLEAGVEKLIHRDDDPTNDVDETADALTDIAMNVVIGAENLTQKDYVNDPVLKQLADNIRGDLKLALLLHVKPAA